MAMVVPLVLGWTLDLISGLPKSVRQRQRSCLYGRDLRSLWQTDFATPRHWIPAQSTPPNRCALWRGPRKAGMTQNIAWWTCFGGTFPPFHLSTFPPSKILSSAFYFFSPPHHDITTPRSPVWIPPSFATTGFGGIILRYAVAKLRMTTGRPKEIHRMQKGAMAERRDGGGQTFP